MRALILPLLLALPACASLPTVPPSPAALADRTVLDDRAGVAAQLLYKAVGIALERARDGGLLPAETVRRFDARAYIAFDAARAAYRAGNAASYRAAMAELTLVRDAVFTAIRTNGTGDRP